MPVSISPPTPNPSPRKQPPSRNGITAARPTHPGDERVGVANGRHHGVRIGGVTLQVQDAEAHTPPGRDQVRTPHVMPSPRGEARAAHLRLNETKMRKKSRSLYADRRSRCQGTPGGSRVSLAKTPT